MSKFYEQTTEQRLDLLKYISDELNDCHEQLDAAEVPRNLIGGEPLGLAERVSYIVHLYLESLDHLEAVQNDLGDCESRWADQSIGYKDSASCVG